MIFTEFHNTLNARYHYQRYITKKSSSIYIIIIVVAIIMSFLTIKYIIDASAISKLQVTIKSVQIQEIKVTYAKLKLNIEISNPTSEDISQLSTDYNIFITGSIVGSGSMRLTDITALTVKGTSTTIIIYFANIANAVIDAILNQNFSLTISGILNAKILFDLLPISQNFSSTYFY